VSSDQSVRRARCAVRRSLKASEVCRRTEAAE
jgi:hypothetical protein